LIIILLLTGFEVNGAFTRFGFGTAVAVHNFCPHPGHDHGLGRSGGRRIGE
jgi:phenylpropionate dioxygenase-like ring-hydroxylating dioxygenase large terminal subunit